MLQGKLSWRKHFAEKFKNYLRSKEKGLGFYSFHAETINDRGIGWLVQLAQKESPCVIFIDEIDCFRLQRGKEKWEDIASFFSMCHASGNKPVMFLAATCTPEYLDIALRRPGRFSKIIHFELPTLAERKAFLVKKLSPLVPNLNAFDIDRLAQETEHCTYRDLTIMVNAALQKTKIKGEPLTQQHLENALDEKI